MHDPEYAWIWLIGASASLVSTLNDSSYRASWRLLGAIGCGGFLATATVGILSESNDSGFAASGYAVGLASISGLLGKHSDQWLRWLTSKVAGKIQLPDGPK